MASDDQIDGTTSPQNDEQLPTELSQSPMADLPWPPPTNWPWRKVGRQISRELEAVRQALTIPMTAEQESSLRSHQTRLERRFGKWKQIVFFSGWRPWHDRDNQTELFT